jgi:hypothetical protein
MAVRGTPKYVPALPNTNFPRPNTHFFPEVKKELGMSLQLLGAAARLHYPPFLLIGPLLRNVCVPTAFYLSIYDNEWVRVSTAKRAETRPCPVCEELIPLRLLAVHLDLELQRVEEIVKAVGSMEVLHDGPDERYVQRTPTQATIMYLPYVFIRSAPHSPKKVVAQHSKPANP